MQSYKELTVADRKLIASQCDQLAAANAKRATINRADDKLPAKTGQLRVPGRY